MRIVLSESQLNTLVENTKTVFKDEDKLKQKWNHISEDTKTNVVVDVSKECKCGPDCEECDCGKKEKETKEDWNPNDSVATQPKWFNARFNGTKMDQ